MYLDNKRNSSRADAISSLITVTTRVRGEGQIKCEEEQKRSNLFRPSCSTLQVSQRKSLKLTPSFLQPAGRRDSRLSFVSHCDSAADFQRRKSMKIQFSPVGRRPSQNNTEEIFRKKLSQDIKTSVFCTDEPGNLFQEIVHHEPRSSKL